MFRAPTHRIPEHPGEILRLEFLGPLGITQRAFAEHLGITTTRLNQIVRGKRRVTADTALLLSQALDMTAAFWLNAQAAYDIAIARQSVRKVRRLPALRKRKTSSSSGARKAAKAR